MCVKEEEEENVPQVIHLQNEKEKRGRKRGEKYLFCCCYVKKKGEGRWESGGKRTGRNAASPPLEKMAINFANSIRIGAA